MSPDAEQADHIDSADHTDNTDHAGPGLEEVMASNDANQGDTQLFLLRIWRRMPQTGGEDGGGNPGDEDALTWHGKVQHVLRGEAHSFSGWDTLVDCLETMLLRDLGDRRRTTDDGRPTTRNSEPTTDN